MKYLIFDAGPIISLTMNGMLPIIEELKKVFDGEFIITPHVKREVVDRPMKIKKYKLEAIQVSDLINRGVLKMSTEIINANTLDRETSKVLKIANGVLRSTQTKEKIKIIQEGEASCLAFANLCKGESLMVVDERTTRMLSESPENLERLMERKLHTPLDAQLSLIADFKKYKYIRSAEILFIAYKKGLIKIGGKKDLLDALLYGVKFKGAAISSNEIEEMKRLV